MIRRLRPPWKDREHLFTPSNITRLEQLCCRNCIYRKQTIRMRIKALRHGPVIWIVRNGKPVNLCPEDNIEDLIIEKGPQLPEDRSGEPEEFYL